MRSETIGLARLAVRQQVEIFGGDQVSLSSLWRAVGSPRQGTIPTAGPKWRPRFWPVFRAISTSSRAFGGLRPPRSRRLWIWEDESKDPWRTGDLMSHELIAWVYASHLDNHREAARTESPTHCSLVTTTAPARLIDHASGCNTRSWRRVQSISRPAIPVASPTGKCLTRCPSLRCHRCR